MSIIAELKDRLSSWLAGRPDVMDALTEETGGKGTDQVVIRGMSVDDAWRHFPGQDRMKFLHWLAQGDPDFVTRCRTAGDLVFISIPKELDDYWDDVQFTDSCHSVSPAEALKETEVLDSAVRNLAERRGELVAEIVDWVGDVYGVLDEYSEKLTYIDDQLRKAREASEGNHE